MKSNTQNAKIEAITEKMIYEIDVNKMLTTAFEVSLESVAITRRLSVDSKIAGIAIEHRNLKVPEGRQRGQGGRQYMHLSLW